MKWVASPHFTKAKRSPQTVDAIAIHTTEGGFRQELSIAENHELTYRGTINYFKKNKSRVSAHYVLGPTGQITQMVKEEDAAHTTTYYNRRSFGIECAGWSRRTETWTPELLETLVELCAYLCVKWEIPVVHPEGTASEGPHGRESGRGRRSYFDAPGIVGHFQVQPWEKEDPGPYFPWEAFMARLKARVESVSGHVDKSAERTDDPDRS